MTRYSGINARIGVQSADTSPYNIELIGDVENFEVRGRGTALQIPSLGNPYLSAIETGTVRPELELRFHPQNTSYLHTYLIVQTGNNLSSHRVAYYSNSADYGVLFGALPMQVEVNFGKNAPVMVRTTLLGTNWSTGLQTSTGNFSKAVSSTEPIMSEQLTSFRLLDGGTARRDLTSLWRRGAFTVNYKTVPVFTGVGVTPTDVLEGVREVNGWAELSVNESTKLLPYVTNASVLNVELGFQVAPMSTCYTFHSATFTLNTVTVPGVDIQRQRFEWQTRYVTRSSL